MHVNNLFKFLVLLLKWTQPNPSQPMGQSNPWTTLSALVAPTNRLSIYNLPAAVNCSREYNLPLLGVRATVRIRADVRGGKCPTFISVRP